MTDLYRHFDADGNLLYVGVSFGAVARLQQHMKASSWAEKIVRVEVQKFRTRNAALRAESVAITREKPAHNTRRPVLPKREPRRQKPAHDHPTRYEFICAKARLACAGLTHADVDGWAGSR